MIATLSGENTYALRQELAKLTSEFVKAYGEMALERVDGAEASFERLQESLQGVPFLTERRMVVLHAPSANKRFAESIERLLGIVSDATDVILYEPKLDKRSSYYKLLKKATDFREYASLDTNGLAHWLTTEAKSRGGALSLADARFLVERTGEDQQSLGQELEKLLIYSPTVTRTSITLLCEPAPQSTVFALLEAAFNGTSAAVLQLYREQRDQKVDEAQIIAMLTWQLRVIALLKVAGARASGEVAREAKLSPYVAQKSQPIAHKLTLAKIKHLTAELLAIDARAKRESIDVDEALQNYLLLMAQ